MARKAQRDAQMILQFYEMRREPRLREARAFLIGRFKSKSFDDFMQTCPPGSEENASFRQATTYWDMLAAIVKRNVVDRELFYETNGEITVIWEKVKHLVPEFRKRWSSPLFLANLEQVAREREAWLAEKAPGALSSLRERLGL